MKNVFKLGALSLTLAVMFVACDPKKSSTTGTGIDPLKADSTKLSEVKTTDTLQAGSLAKAVDTVSNGKTLKTKSIDTVSNKVIETKVKKNESKTKIKKVVKE